VYAFSCNYCRTAISYLYDFIRLYASVSLAITCAICVILVVIVQLSSFLAAEIAYKLIKLNITSFMATLTKVVAHCLLRFLLTDVACIKDRTSKAYFQFIDRFLVIITCKPCLDQLIRLAIQASDDLALQRVFVNDHTLAICCRTAVSYLYVLYVYTPAITCAICVILVVIITCRHFWQQKSGISSISSISRHLWRL